MPKTPLKYFGSRDQQQDDFFALIKGYIHQHRQGKKFTYCYDLFAGSASMSLQAIQYDIAEYYVVNDLYPPLAIFWQTVNTNPKEIIIQYQLLLQKYLVTDSPEKYYLTTQTTFNQLAIPTKQSPQKIAFAAQFAFIINHAKNGMPLLSGQNKQHLQCEWIAEAGALTIDKNFADLVFEANALIKSKKVVFSSKSFTYFLDKITDDDLVLLDPPYPDMPDAAEQPNKHIYQRSEPKSELQQALTSLLMRLDNMNTPFLMFYGVLGLENHYPIYWPKGHVLRLSGEPQGPFNEYIEHTYLSKELASILVQPGYQDKFQPCFYRIFETQATHNAHKTALVWHDKKYTYEQLNKAANCLARFLLQNGLEQQLQQNQKTNQETLITIYLDRSPQLIISILAIMKTGAAYLPLDSNATQLEVAAAYERIQQSGSRLLLTHEKLAIQLQQIAHKTEKINWQATQIVAIERDDYLCEKFIANLHDINHLNLNRKINPENLAYVLYTSGSTGKPKGVEILQRGLPYAFASHQNLLNISPEDRVAQFGSIGFDASVMEIMMGLGSGAELHLVDENSYKDAAQLTQLLQDHKITIAIQTPKMLATLKPSAFPNLRGLLIVGDSFPKTLSDQWLVDIQVNGITKPRDVVNGYGLTETTICTTLELCDKEKPLTIGQPILGCNIYLRPLTEEENDLTNQAITISDHTSWLKPQNQENLSIQDIQKGAVYIAGPCLARGYWKNPQQTAQRFNAVTINHQSTTLYQSGDIGFFARATGEISLSGRLDRQVKLRGQRMELSELEAQVKATAEAIGIKIADVRAVVDEQNNSKRLAVYIALSCKESALITKDRANPSAESLDLLRNLRAQLLKKLPAYMCPALVNFLLIEQLIYKDNDKKSYDDQKMKQQWATPCLTLPHKTPVFIEQLEDDKKTDLKTLHQLIAKSLNLPPQALSYEEDYYAQGGDSLTVKWLLATIKKQPFVSRALMTTLQTITIKMFDEDSSVSGIWEMLQKKIQEEQNRIILANRTIKNLNTPRTTRNLLLATGHYKNEQGEFKHWLKTPAPIYVIHALTGDTELDYAGSEINQLPYDYTPLSVAPLDTWKTLNELADQHIDTIEICHAQDVPYWLIGWSSGGVIARLMAEKLRQQGKRVFTLLLDSHHPETIKSLDTKQHAEILLELMQKITETLYSVWQLPNTVQFVITPLKTLQKINDHTTQVKKIFADLRTEIATKQEQLNNLNPSSLERGKKLIDCSEQLLIAELTSTHLVTNLTADDTLLLARTSTQKWGEHLGWQVTPKAEEQTLTINTNHFELLHNPELTKQIKPWITDRLLRLMSNCYDAADDYDNGRYEDCIRKFDIAIQINPKDAAAFNTRGHAKFFLEQYEEAIKDLNEAINLNPNNINALFRRGWIKFCLDQHTGAIEDFRKVAVLDPNHPVGLIAPNYIGNYSNQHTMHIDELNGSIHDAPPNSEFFNERGRTKYFLKLYKDAIEDFDRAIDLCPDSEYFYARGSAKICLDQYKEAIKDFDRAIDINPHSSEYFYARGVAKNHLKKYDQAIKDFEQGINLNPKNPKNFFLRGFVKLCLEEYTESIEDLSKTIGLDSKNEKAFFLRGLVKIQLNRHKEAIEDFDRAIELDPHHPDYFYMRGTAKDHLGKNEEAIKDFEQHNNLKTKNSTQAITPAPKKPTDTEHYVIRLIELDQSIRLHKLSLFLTITQEISALPAITDFPKKSSDTNQQNTPPTSRADDHTTTETPNPRLRAKL